MGKQPTAGAAAAGTASRKRGTKESGQRSIAAAFPAKRPHDTSEAGHSNGTGPVAPGATYIRSGQLATALVDCQTGQTAGRGAGSATDHHHPPPLAAGAAAADCLGSHPQQEQQAAAPSVAEEQQHNQEEQHKQQPAAAEHQEPGKPVAAAKKAAAAGKRKPRASKTKAAAATAAAAAAAAQDADSSAAEDAAADSDAEVVVEADDAAAAGSAAAAASFTEQEVAQVQQSLLAWYDRVQRVLPWRRNPHHKPQQNPSTEPQQAPEDGGSGSGKQKKPSKKQLAAAAEAEAVLAAARPAPAELAPQEFAYRVWVSEIMLQQTQVSRVIAYFNRWVAVWPTVAALAAASQEEVNEVWAGLGYYRRARYLLEGAQHIVDKLGGKFPETAAELRQIPGVGPYTAAAVASIAFNDGAAAVDGNVIRVCARLRALRGNPAKMAKVWDRLAAQLLHPARPGCHNQAMMELGATVCKPANPACGACPVSSCCSAYTLAAAHAAGSAAAVAAGDVEDAPRVTDYPEKVTKAAKAEQHVAVCVLKVLLLPGAETPAAVAAAAASAAAAAAAGATAAAGKGSIRSFFKPAPKQQQQPQPQQACEAELLAAGAATHYLLVQRPETGVLAGLWEFPGVVIDCQPSPSARRAAVDGYLSGTLGVLLPAASSSSSSHTGSTSSSSKRAKGSSAAGPAPAAEAGVLVVQRRQLGSVVHIFSHIRQTLHAEELVLLAPSLDAVCSMAAAAAATAGEAHAAGADKEDGEELAAAGSGSACSDEEDHQQDGKKGTTKKRPRKETTVAAASANARPALRWVNGADMVQAGLTSGVRKVFNLSVK